MSSKIQILLAIIPSLVLFLNSSKIGKKLKLLDFPDNKRKIHVSPIPKMGGITLYLSVIIFLTLNLKSIDNYSNVIFISFFFALGLIDDIKDLSSNLRLVLSFIFLIIFFNFDKDILINNIKIFNKDLNLTFYFHFIVILLLTTLCVLLLQNAINMMDGINTVCAIFIIFCLVLFSIKNSFTSLDWLMIINLLIFTAFNYKNKIFLGNSGAYFLSSFLAFKILYQNYSSYAYTAEEIFIILMIPGLDMFRLFIFRILKKQNPFKADNDHLHHLILKYFNGKYNLSIILTIIVVCIPGLFDYFFNVQSYYLIFSFIFLYSLLIVKLKKKLF